MKIQYVVTVKYAPKSTFDTGVMRIRVNSQTEEDAAIDVKKHSLFPHDGIVTKVRKATFIKNSIN